MQIEQDKCWRELCAKRKTTTHLCLTYVLWIRLFSRHVFSENNFVNWCIHILWDTFPVVVVIKRVWEGYLQLHIFTSLLVPKTKSRSDYLETAYLSTLIGIKMHSYWICTYQILKIHATYICKFAPLLQNGVGIFFLKMLGIHRHTAALKTHCSYCKCGSFSRVPLEDNVSSESLPFWLCLLLTCTHALLFEKTWAVFFCVSGELQLQWHF